MSAFANPTSPNIPVRADSNPRESKRLAVHAEGANNDLNPINNKSKMPSVGKLGVRGDGRQK